MRILKTLEENAELPLNDIGRKIGLMSPSAVSKRISKLKESGYIEKIVARVNYRMLGFDFAAITLIEGKIQKKCEENLGKKLSSIPSVVSVHSTLGESDFILRTLNRNMTEYTKTLDLMMDTKSIERSTTRAIVKTYRDADFSNVKLADEDARND